MITVTNLIKRYDDLSAVDNISFTIQKGEVVGFLGPNGAGKTTTMRMIAGFISPDQGEIEVAGISLQKNPVEARRHLGYLSENNPLYNDMLVSEMLSLAANLQGINQKKRKEAFDFVVAASGIGKVYYKPIGELSKGYRQRVGLALAILNQPEVIILDEPTEGLDPNQRIEIRNLIKGLAQNHTVILSTHVMQEASLVASRLLIINKGKIVSDGTPQGLVDLGQEDRIIEVEIEGEEVEKYLAKIEGIKKIELIKTEKSVLAAKIITQKDLLIEPKIAELSHLYHWTIWKIKLEEKQLEEIFRSLTQEK